MCEDIDLCGACMRALVAARVKMSREAAPRPAPPRQVGAVSDSQACVISKRAGGLVWHVQAGSCTSIAAICTIRGCH